MDKEAAFPEAYRDPDDSDRVKYLPGMSLRDWFAGQALVGMGTWVPPYYWPKDAELCRLKAEFAYQQADAMLDERSK